MIGASADVLFLGGAKVSAFSLPRGLREAQSPQPLWTTLVERPETSLRAHLSGDQVFQPKDTSGCFVLEQESGKCGRYNEMNAMRGLLVTDEALFAVTEDGLKRVAR
jgi:hypothetical protein